MNLTDFVVIQLLVAGVAATLVWLDSSGVFIKAFDKIFRR